MKYPMWRISRTAAGKSKDLSTVSCRKLITDPVSLTPGRFPSLSSQSDTQRIRPDRTGSSEQHNNVEKRNLLIFQPRIFMVPYGIVKFRGKILLNPNVRKIEDAADPRRQGWSCSKLPRTLDNKGDAIPSTFPKGRKHDKSNGITPISLLLLFSSNPCHVFYATIG